MQFHSLDRICSAYQEVSAAECNKAAEAFKVLCGSVPGYTTNSAKQATPSRRCEDGRLILLRSPREFQEVIALEGRVAPQIDPVLKRKTLCCARLVREMSSRALVFVGLVAGSTVGVFVVPKKQGKRRLIFDTRRVNQHFRRPWHCALPTPSSWAGLQLPDNSAYHMVQTDVGTAFCCTPGSRWNV